MNDNTPKPGDFLEWLKANQPAKSHMYPRRIRLDDLLDSIDTMVESTRIVDEHYIWHGPINEHGHPVIFAAGSLLPAIWFFFELCEGQWHTSAELHRNCSEPLCVKADHMEIRWVDGAFSK